MSYNLFWRSPGVHTYGTKNTITVPVGQVVSDQASLRFTGKGAANTGKIQQENLMRLLESFAGPTPPDYPTVGQFWYDTTFSQLKICVAAAPLPVEWREIRSSISITDVGEPPPDGAVLGDSWFQRTGSMSGFLYIYTGLGRYPEVNGVIGGWDQVWPESDRAAAREEYEIMFGLIDQFIGPTSSRGSGATNRAIRNFAPLGDLDSSMRNAWRAHTPLDGNVLAFQPADPNYPQQAFASKKYVITVNTLGLQSVAAGNAYVSGFSPTTGAPADVDGKIWVNGVLTTLPRASLWYHQIVSDAWIMWDTTSTLTSSSGPAKYFVVQKVGNQWQYDTDLVTITPSAGWQNFTPVAGMYLIGLITTTLNGSTSNDPNTSYIQPWDNTVEIIQPDNDLLKVEPNSTDWDALLAAGRYALNRLDVPSAALADFRQTPFVTDGRQPDPSLLALASTDVRYPPAARRASRRFGSVTLARYFNEANNVISLAMPNRYVLKGLLGTSGVSAAFNSNVTVDTQATFSADAGASGGSFGTSAKPLTVGIHFNSRDEYERFFFSGQAIEVRMAHTPSTNTAADLNLKTITDTQGRIRITANRTYVMTPAATPALSGTTGTNGGVNIVNTPTLMTNLASGGATISLNAQADSTHFSLTLSVAAGGATSGTFAITIATINDNELWAGGRVYPSVLPFVVGTDAVLGVYTNTTPGVPLAIVAAPQNVSANINQPALFSVVAKATPGPISYQWNRNGVPISGATSSTYVRTAIISDSGSSYSCAVTANATTITSSAGTLTVSSTTAPTITVAGFTALAGTSMLVIGTFTGDGVTLSAKRNGASVTINQLGSPLYTIGSNIFVNVDFTLLSNNSDIYSITATNTGGSANGSGTVVINSRTFTLAANNATIASATPASLRIASELSSDAPIATTAISAGVLPPGLSLDGTLGFVSGTPTSPGTYTFTAHFTPAANYTSIVETFVNVTLTVT
jgi:hypothetical protein